VVGEFERHVVVHPNHLGFALDILRHFIATISVTYISLTSTIMVLIPFSMTIIENHGQSDRSRTFRREKELLWDGRKTVGPARRDTSEKTSRPLDCIINEPKALLVGMP
jgi:hypothetical protein